MTTIHGRKGGRAYECFYKGKRVTVYADTLLQARDMAAEHFRARKPWEVAAVLADQPVATAAL